MQKIHYSTTNKTESHDITDKSLKVALNIIFLNITTLLYDIIICSAAVQNFNLFINLTILYSSGLGRTFLPGKLVKGPSKKDPLNPKTQSKESNKSKGFRHHFGAHQEISWYSGGPVRHCLPSIKDITNIYFYSQLKYKRNCNLYHASSNLVQL